MNNDIIDKNSKEYINARRRKYYAKNKEKYREWAKKWEKANQDKVKASRKKHYEANKKRILAQQKEYIKKNRAKVTGLVLRRRKEVAEELKKQGQIWTYLPKTQRQNKMVESLAKKMNVSEETARGYLEQFNWNYKGILEDLKKCICCDYIDLEGYMHHNQDGWYCDTCWISRN